MKSQLLFLVACAVCTALSGIAFADKINGSISGLVVDARSNEPLAAVEVHLMQGQDPRPAFTAVSNKRGKFKFRKIPGGAWLLGIRDANMAPAEDDQKVELDGKVKKAEDLQLKAAKGAGIEGAVYSDEDFEHGVPGLVLEFRNPPSDLYFSPDDKKNVRIFHATTDAEGKFAFHGLPNGPYSLDSAPEQPWVKCSKVFIADEALMNHEFELRRGQQLKNVEFQVRPTGNVSGTVVNMAGSPVPDAEAGCDKASRNGDYSAKDISPQARTASEVTLNVVDDLTGQPLPDYALEAFDRIRPDETKIQRNVTIEKPFKEPLHDSIWNFLVKAEGYFSEYRDVAIRADKPTDFEFRMRKPAVVEGKVHDADGNPLPNTSVEVISLIYRPQDESQEPIKVKTDEAGNFAAKDVYPGDVVIRVERPNFLLVKQQHPLASGQTLQLDVAMSLKPVTSRPAAAQAKPAPVAQTPPAVEALPSQKEAVPSGAGAGTVAGQVTTGGKPLQGAQVSCSMSREPLTTDEQGNFAFEGITPGEGRLVVDWQADGRLRGIAKLITVGPGSTRADIDFAPATSGITGKLYLNGVSARGAVRVRFVNLKTGDPEDFLLPMRDDGSYSFTLPAGNALIQFCAEKRAVAYEMALPDGDLLQMDAEITDGVDVAGAVSGLKLQETDTVRLLAGKVGLADINKYPLSSLDPRVVSGMRIINNTFCLKNISPGEYTLVVVRFSTRNYVEYEALAVKPITVGKEPLNNVTIEAP